MSPTDENASSGSLPDGDPRTVPSVHDRLVRALRERIEGRAVLRDVSTSGTEAVSLLLDVDGRRMELCLLLVAPVPLFWLESIAGRKPSEGEGFADWLRRRIVGVAVTGVASGASGRILRLEFASPARRGPADAPSALVLDPIPSACRLLVLDADGRVEQRYPPTSHGRPSGRGAPGEAYAEPAGQHREPWQKAVAPDAQATRAGELWIGTTSPRHAQQPAIFLSPVPLPGSVPLAALDASREAGGLWIRTLRQRESERRIAQLLRTERKHLTQLSRRLRDELTEADQGAGLRRQAEALLAFGSRVPKGASQARLEDPSGSGESLDIRLDPALSFSRNAARLFQKAARLERALPVRRRKLEQVEALLEHIAAWTDRTTVGGMDRSTLEEARALASGLEPGLRRRWTAALVEWRQALDATRTPIERAGFDARRTATAREARSHAAEETGPHPRSFELPGGWIVLVGRSNQENDALTHRMARPDDLWLHARGVAGSHVVLRRAGRKDPPGKRVIEQAAGIAAYFSKARTSGMAPVIYTEKRHVRKPRKGAPGLAVCTREKVVMVEPRLPARNSSAQ
jgi:predicted ribosome quality control (RQC) complex YloA/Tae2 family protein